MVRKYRILLINQLAKLFYILVGWYPAPTILSYLWNFGVLALVCMLLQVGTGILLAMHYTPEFGLAFTSVEHLMRDVNYGWLLRYVHLNGASMLFIATYLHM